MSMTDTPDTDDESHPTSRPTVSPSRTLTRTSLPSRPRRRSCRSPPARRGRTSRPCAPVRRVGIRELAGVIAAAAVSGDPSTVHRIMTSPGARAPSASRPPSPTSPWSAPTTSGAIYRPAYQAELVEIVSLRLAARRRPPPGRPRAGRLPRTRRSTAWTTLPTDGDPVAEKVAITSDPPPVDPDIGAGADLGRWQRHVPAAPRLRFAVVRGGLRPGRRRRLRPEDRHVRRHRAPRRRHRCARPHSTTRSSTIVGKLFGGLTRPSSPPSGPLFCLVSPGPRRRRMIGVTEPRTGPPSGTAPSGSGRSRVDEPSAGSRSSSTPTCPPRRASSARATAPRGTTCPARRSASRAVNVGLLGLDIAVYGYGALGVQYPGALVKTTVP